MITELESALHDAGADLHLDVPLSEVVARGARIRRRRRGVRTVVAGTALAATAGVVAVALPPGSSPIPAAEAGWGPAMINLQPEPLAKADQACRSMLGDTPPGGPPGPGLPADARLVAADSRDGISVLLYRYGDKFADCALIPSANGEGYGGGGSDGRQWRPLPPGRHFEALGGAAAVTLLQPPDLSHGGDLPDGTMSQGVSSFRVSDDVHRLVLHVAGEDLEARIGDELAVCWLPDGILMSAYDASTVTAYAADGSELETRSLLDSVARD